MEIDKLNKSMCEELFSGRLDVTEEHRGVKSYVRRQRDWLHRHNAEDMRVLQKVLGILQEIESCCKTKKNIEEIFCEKRNASTPLGIELGINLY